MERETDEATLFMHGEKGEMMPEVHVQRLADGLGFGEGQISHNDRVDEVDEETRHAVEGLIESPRILVKVDVDSSGRRLDDDGCGDGRGVRRIFEGLTEKFKSLNRSKVFAGGAGMTMASMVGLGQTAGTTLRSAFSGAIHRLQDREIGFGAHTDDGHSDENGGCGAIDKAQTVLKNVGKYRDQISGVMTDVLGLDDTGMDGVFKNYADYADDVADEDYKGKEVAGEIIDSGKIVKELTGKHQEMYIVLNDVEGYTVNQQIIREVSGEKVQVFAVDLWRLKELAAQLYDTPEQQALALKSMVVYTLATAATLTKGDLPVYLTSSVLQPVAA
jgi:hypothetical protein